MFNKLKQVIDAKQAYKDRYEVETMFKAIQEADKRKKEQEQGLEKGIYQLAPNTEQDEEGQ